jgi:hypothetical protein
LAFDASIFGQPICIATTAVIGQSYCNCGRGNIGGGDGGNCGVAVQENASLTTNRTEDISVAIGYKVTGTRKLATGNLVTAVVDFAVSNYLQILVGVEIGCPTQEGDVPNFGGEQGIPIKTGIAAGR